MAVNIGKNILSGARRLGSLDIFVALLLVVAVDLVARGSGMVGGPLSTNFGAPYRSRIWYAAKDYIAQKSAPDVVLLGPSTMTCATFGADALLLKKSQSELLKHQSQYLETKLRESGDANPRTFCLAIPGQVPSDAYMIAKTLLHGDRAPRTIFYGITARDFIDSTLAAPADTDTFKLMSAIGDSPELQFECRNSPWEKLNYQLSQISYLYGHKSFLVSQQHNLVHLLTQLTGKNDFDPFKSPILVRKQAMMQLPEDYGANEVEAAYNPQPKKYVDNLDEYRSRYRYFKPKSFEQQLAFFKRLVEFCKTENIHLCVANVPITAQNRYLIAPAVYSLYLSRTSQIAKTGGANYVDLAVCPDFVAADFSDSIHLNGTGGQKMLDHIATLIGRDSQVAARAATTDGGPCR